MNKKGPVIVIEDDEDDQDFLSEVFRKLDYPNEVIFFNDGEAAYQFLRGNNVLPFIILSDINMPKLNGFQLREKFKNDADLHMKSVPYVFFTTALTRQAVTDAYRLSVQGFFEKRPNMKELEKTISSIMEYWLRCAAPNHFIE